MSRRRLTRVRYGSISDASIPTRVDLDQAFRKLPGIQSMHNQAARREMVMNTVRWTISTAPEIFLLLAVAIGTILGRVKIRGFALGTTACTLIVAVLIGQLGAFTFPSVLRIVLFTLFVFPIGSRSGPEFFASFRFQTLPHLPPAPVLAATCLL